MAPLEGYLEHADELAQEVVNAWGVNTRAGIPLTDDFMAVFDKTCRYRDAKSQADNSRRVNILSEQVVAEEKATRQAFVEAYKAFGRSTRQQLSGLAGSPRRTWHAPAAVACTFHIENQFRPSRLSLPS